MAATSEISRRQKALSFPQASTLSRLAHSVLILACGLAVFLFGSNYSSLFPTNHSTAFRAGLAALFLVAALAQRRSERWRGYWPVTYAFFVATAVFLAADLALPLRDRLMSAVGLGGDDPMTQAGAKVWETALALTVILSLARLAGWRRKTLYLTKGNLKLGLLAGGLVLVNLVSAAILVAGSQNARQELLGQTLLWGGIFALANGLLEELWVRGLFLDRMEPFVGASGAVVVTGLIFAAMHSGASYLPPAAVPHFLLNTLTLGLGLAWLMRWTGSLWGAVLIHAAADLWWFLAIGF
jgi:membrane protease YdiL (CAAX protease family)